MTTGERPARTSPVGLVQRDSPRAAREPPGRFAALAEAIGEAEGLLGAIDLVRVEADHKIRDVTVLAADAAHLDLILEAVRAVPGTEVLDVSDRTFLMHLGGKLEVTRAIR